MSNEFNKVKCYIVETAPGKIRKEKAKVSTRYATLTTDSLSFYKKAEDSLACQFIPTEYIDGAEKTDSHKGKHCIKILLSNTEHPIIFGTEKEEITNICLHLLKKCKTRKNINQWLIDPKLITLEKQIGCGAFGKVYKAKMSGTPVAVKEILPGGDEDEVEKEIDLLSKIRNPNCVRLLGIYRNEGTEKLFIVTEFVDAGDLSNILYKSGVELPEIVKLKILRDVARGVAFLHENNIIHRDLKTDNCLIRSTDPSASQFAVVADFGISKIAPSMGEAGGNCTMGVGTPVYMAPECFKKSYTTKLDVYSFGVLMNEVFSKARPWSHVQTQWNSEIHDLVDKGERPLMNFTEQTTPHKAEIARIIDACWQTKPEDRPTMKKVLQDLDELIESIEKSSGGWRQGSYQQLPITTPMQPQYNTHTPSTHQTPVANPNMYNTVTGAIAHPPAQRGGSPYASSSGVLSHQGSVGQFATPGQNPYASQGSSPYASQGQNPYVPPGPNAFPPQNPFASQTVYAHGAPPGGFPNPGLYSSTPGGFPGAYPPQNPYLSQPNNNYPPHAFPANTGYPGAVPAVDDVISKGIQFVGQSGGTVSIQALGQFLAQFSSEQAGLAFSYAISQHFEKGQPIVSVNSLTRIKLWFFPVKDENEGDSYENNLYEGGSMYEGGPDNAGWTISTVNAVICVPYFKGFMEGPAAGAALKAAGAAPGQFYLRFSAEPGKIAIAVIDANGQPKHWKSTLLADGVVLDSEGRKHDSINAWLAHHHKVPLKGANCPLIGPCPR